MLLVLSMAGRDGKFDHIARHTRQQNHWRLVVLPNSHSLIQRRMQNDRSVLPSRKLFVSNAACVPISAHVFSRSRTGTPFISTCG